MRDDESEITIVDDYSGCSESEDGVITAARRFGLTSKIAVSLDGSVNVTRVVKNDEDTNDFLFAAALTDKNINIYNGETLTKVTSLHGHDKTITGLKFSKAKSNLLYSSSLDGTVRVWDLRQSKTILQYQDNANNKVKPLNSFDVNCDETFMCGGTELIVTDALILFWDMRSSKLLGGYWESHTDDITQIDFHESERNTLATGSTDGLINLFDISQTSEEDALINSFNTESSVDIIRWCQNGERIACLTHDETLQLWNVSDDEVNTVRSYNRNDVKKALKLARPPSRFINLAVHRKTGAPSVIATSHRYAEEPLIMTTYCSAA